MTTEIQTWRQRMGDELIVGDGKNAIAARDGEITDLRKALAASQEELEEWRFTNKIDELQRLVNAKQAEIDRLMLEFCPDEMTAEQKASWAASQRVAAPQGIGWGLKNIPLFYDNKTGPADAAPATSLIENAARQYVAAVNDPYTSVVGELRWFKQLEAALAQHAGSGEAKPVAWCDESKSQLWWADGHPTLETGGKQLLYTSSPSQPDSERDAVLREMLSTGYEGGTMTDEDLGGKITLHYVSRADAENAFNSISNAIDAAMAAQKGK